MTTFDFPSVRPSLVRWKLKSNTGVQVSPHTGAIKTIGRGGERWMAEMHFLNLTGDDKAVMKAWFSRLLGQTHRFNFEDYSSVSRGAFGGSPVINGADQTGLTLDIDGCDASVTNWIRAGDMFTIGSGSAQELKMAVRDFNSDFTGAINNLEFVPRIRVSPNDNDPIVVSSPTGVFLLESDEAGWPNRPGDFSDFVIRAVEDIA